MLRHEKGALNQGDTLFTSSFSIFLKIERRIESHNYWIIDSMKWPIDNPSSQETLFLLQINQLNRAHHPINGINFQASSLKQSTLWTTTKNHHKNRIMNINWILNETNRRAKIKKKGSSPLNRIFWVKEKMRCKSFYSYSLYRHSHHHHHRIVKFEPFTILC